MLVSLALGGLLSGIWLVYIFALRKIIKDPAIILASIIGPIHALLIMVILAGGIYLSHLSLRFIGVKEGADAAETFSLTWIVVWLATALCTAPILYKVGKALRELDVE